MGQLRQNADIASGRKRQRGWHERGRSISTQLLVVYLVDVPRTQVSVYPRTKCTPSTPIMGSKVFTLIPFEHYGLHTFYPLLYTYLERTSICVIVV